MQDDQRISGFRFSPTGDAAERSEDRSRSDLDLGDLVVVLLAGTLAGLRDRLRAEGFEEAGDMVGELSDRCDSFIEERGR